MPRAAEHLRWHCLHTRTGSLYSSRGIIALNPVHDEQNTPPHTLQWCRLTMGLNCASHFGHASTSSSGTQSGLLGGSRADSPSSRPPQTPAVFCIARLHEKRLNASINEPDMLGVRKLPQRVCVICINRKTWHTVDGDVGLSTIFNALR